MKLATKLQNQFSQSNLTGLGGSNPTSDLFGPDDRLCISQQDRTMLIAEVEATLDLQGKVTEYQVVSTPGIITLAKESPDHDGDGSLNTEDR